MSINHLYNQLQTKKTKPRLTTRFHVFYEGQVTERQIINKLKQDLSQDDQFVNLYELEVASETISTTGKLLKVLKTMHYDALSANSDDVHSVTIMPYDIVILFMDFDIFSNKHHHNNPNPQNVTLGQRTRFYDNLLSVINYSKKHQLTTLLAPSFLSIEYAICLGCIQNKINLNNVKADKDDVFKVFDQTLNHRIGRFKKDFNNLLNNSKLFSTDQMLINAQTLRKQWAYPQDSKALMRYLSKFDNFERMIQDNSKPYTYVDVLHENIAVVKQMDI